MKKDGRKLDRKAQEAIRLMAVRRVREGESPSDVIASYGMNRTTIHKWLNRANGKGSGLSNLHSKKGTGRPRSLTDKQEQQMFRWINGKNPMQYGFDFGLWSRRIVGELVFKKYGMKLSLGSIGTLLARLNLTPQKPLQQIYQRDKKTIKRWQRDVYPTITKQAKKEKADIYFWGESDFHTDSAAKNTSASPGNTLAIKVPGRGQNIHTASAINSKGEFWLATYSGRLTGELFVELLVGLMYKRKRPLHLVIDGLPAHKKKCVKEYVATFNGKLQRHFVSGHASG